MSTLEISESKDSDVPKPRPSRFHSLLGSLSIAAIPALAVQALLYYFFRKSFLDFVPYFDDEMVYWLSSLTFDHAGLQGGYFAINEVVPALPFIHFGAHGPLMPMTYAVLGSFLGPWKPYSGVIVNLCLCVLSLLCFIRVTKPQRTQIVLLTIFLACFWPLVLMLPVNMQEGLHLSIGILLASCLYLILSERASRFVKTSTILLLCFASFVRPSWSVLFFPTLLLLWPPRDFAGLIKKVSIGLGLAILAFVVFKVLGAPYPHQRIHFIKVLTLQAGPEEFFQYTMNNIRKLYDTTLDPVGFPQRVEVFFIILGSLFLALFNRFRKGIPFLAPENRPWLFHIANLGLIVLCTITLYFIGSYGDFRVWSGHFVLTLLLLIALGKRPGLILVSGVIMANLYFAPQYLQFFHNFRAYSYQVPDKASLESFSRQVQDKLVYIKNADPWCNTMLAMTSPFVDYHMTRITPGIGVSDLYSWRETKRPYRSKYFLVDLKQAIGQEGDDRIQVRPKENGASTFLVNSEEIANVQFLADTPIGTLWLNLDARCPQT